MTKMYALASSKEKGEAGEFTAGPTPIFKDLLSYVTDEGSNSLFVLEEGKDPRWIDTDSTNTVVL